MGNLKSTVTVTGTVLLEGSLRHRRCNFTSNCACRAKLHERPAQRGTSRSRTIAKSTNTSDPRTKYIQILRMLRKMKPSRCTAPATTFALCPYLMQQFKFDLQKEQHHRSKVLRLPPKMHMDISKVLCLPRKIILRKPFKNIAPVTKQFSTECDQGPCLQEKATFQVLPICEITAVFFLKTGWKMTMREVLTTENSRPPPFAFNTRPSNPPNTTL